MLVTFFFSSMGFTDSVPPDLVLDKVSFQVTARQWVTTKSALVNVSINATLTNTDLIKARAEITDSLDKIAAGAWHIVQFDRSQDSSGLEKLTVLARARVDQHVLPNVYKNAKTVSKPGMNYEISSIEFKPSLEEVQEAKNQLRQTLYQQAHQELSRLNQVYSGQSYSLHQLIFVEGDAQPQPQAFKARELVNTMALAAASAPAVAVSNELTMTALVQVASNRKQES
nr:hypothetical protein [Legionella yabuuchiae]